MAALYIAVDITALPAHYESYGLVVAESLQCGTPDLISGTVGAGTLVSDSDGVIIEEISAQSIANGISDLKERPRTVTANFVQTHRLSLESHIESLLKVSVCKTNS